MPSYYKREIPVWTTYDKEGMLGETERNSSVSLSTAVLGLLVGVALGGVIGLLIARRSRRLHMLLSPFFLLGTVLLLSRPVAAQTPREQPGTPHHHHQHPNHQDHHAMDMEGMVMNENKDQLPQDCAALAGEQDIIVRAGKKYAQQFNGTMFAYDQQEWDVAPCTKVTVTLINEDQVRHQWMIHGLPRYLYPEGMFHLEVNGAGKKSGTFIVPSAAKTYLVHCDVAQHMEKGMKAQLKVGGGNGDLPSIPGLTSPRQPDIYDTKWSWWRSRVAVVFGIIGAALVVRKRRSRS
jgi:hypothetical protein